ncbi:MAG: clan AA aspartic protease [Acetobacteraceae bacterium]|nr:clan AA aspartic protease [Acetobacteraceae bacterium]
MARAARPPGLLLLLALGASRALAPAPALALLLSPWFSVASRACALAPRATVPLRVEASQFLVAVTVDGREATFKLDTGAARSLVTPEAARRLDLPRDPWVGATVWGVGGIERASVAAPRSLSLAGVPLRQRGPTGEAALAVGPLAAPPGGGPPVDGLLGRDLLSTFDVELDPPAHRMTLWDVSGCAGRFLPWRGPYDAIAPLAGYGDALALPALANGESLRALPDTGATDTMLGAPGVIRLGLTGPGVPTGTVRGVGTRARPAWTTRLSSLRVGNQTERDVPVLATRLRFYPVVDMLLGADWFRTRRVWLSYATKQVFVAEG